MLRIAMARYYRGTGVTDPEGIELFEEALQLLDPEALPLRALAIASLARRRSLQADPGFTDDVDAANELLADIESSAPKVAAAVRLWIVHATWVFRALRTGSACVTRPWPSRPRPRTRGGPSSPPASTSPLRSTCPRALADGARPASRVRDQPGTVMELGETTG